MTLKNIYNNFLKIIYVFAFIFNTFFWMIVVNMKITLFVKILFFLFFVANLSSIMFTFLFLTKKGDIVWQ